jgi:hypothetical protein
MQRLVEVESVVSAQYRCLVTKVGEVRGVARLHLGDEIVGRREVVFIELEHQALGHLLRKVEGEGILTLAILSRC